MEFVKRRNTPALSGDELVQTSLRILRQQLGRLPEANPFTQFKARFEADLEWLATEGLETFHQYSFATLRQFGAAYELAATYLHWLQERTRKTLTEPIEAFTSLATGAKTLQFHLARAIARQKPLDLSTLDRLASRWHSAMENVQATFQ